MTLAEIEAALVKAGGRALSNAAAKKLYDLADALAAERERIEALIPSKAERACENCGHIEHFRCCECGHVQSALLAERGK